MKSYILYLFFVLAVFNAKSQENKTLIFRFDFQDFFVKDTVSLSINGHLVLNKKVVTSDFWYGLTDAVIRVYLYRGKGLIKIGKDSIITKRISTPIKLKATVNGKESKYKINLEKGKYTGISKKDKNIYELIFYQSKNPFEYY